MSTTSFSRTVALFLAIGIMAPSVFFAVPQKAHAWTDIPAGIQRAYQIVQETLTEVHTFTSMASDIASTLNLLIFQPLAFVLSGNLMKMLTASVVGFVIGKANGTGIPQFIVDVRQSMQTVQTSAAYAYLKQVNLTNSPFSSSITSALRTDYLQGSSLKGFWEANLCSLSRSSPNVPAYLAGNWSQGGVAAWFALTTETQNNPYLLLEATKAQMRNVIGPGVGGASGARTQMLAWGQGMMSWCGASDATTDTQAAGALSTMESCIAQGNTPAYCDKAYANAGGAVGGIDPGDPCTNKDGTSGTIKTPGSVISATLNKVLGGQQDEIVRFGNMGPQITSILGDIANVVNTVKFASNLLGGDNGPGGLLGVGQASASSQAPLNQFAPTQDANGNFTSGYIGISDAQINRDAASSPVITATSNDVTTRINMYKTSWVSIDAAAKSAQSSVTALKNTCQAAATSATSMLPSANYNYKTLLNAFITSSTAQAAAAQTSLTGTILPIIDKATIASTTAAAAAAMNEKVKNEAGTTAYQADLKALLSMPPTSAEVSQAYKDAQVTSPNEATSTPPGSLIVDPYPSIVDQMTLISSNAKDLLLVCVVPTDPGTAH